MTNSRNLIRAAARTGVSWLGRTSPALGSLAAESLFRSPARHARPAWESRVLEDAHAFSIARGGTRLPAWEWGDGPTILLIHGWEGRGSQLGGFVAPLVHAGHRVVTFDFPGHGDADDARVTVMDFVRTLVELHPAFGKIHGVIAHSMGAAASALAHVRSPFVERMVLIAPPRSPRHFFDAFVSYLDLDGRTKDATERRLESRYGIKLDDTDTVRFARLIATPALVIHDREDREVPFDHGARVASALENGTLLETTGLGHRRILKDDAVIRSATEFVASPAAASLAYQLDTELFERELRVA